MHLTQTDVENYHRDGYVLAPNLFCEEEVAAMVAAIEGGGRVSSTVRERQDSGGKKAKLAIWHELGDDIWAAASICPRIVNGVRILLGEEIAFFHGKVMLKEAKSGGAWEWHQDYGYWYLYEQFAYPRLLSAFVALDAATKENGCLQVLRGSHKLGRLEHTIIGDQTGVEPKRMEQVLPLFERVHCEMSRGSVLFFHCNLLHTSAPNNSDRHRRSFIMCYNALANPALNPKARVGRLPCPVGADDAILRFAQKRAA